MGDFNCTMAQPEMSVLFNRTRLQPPHCQVNTFPSWSPNRAIDHILMTDTLKVSKLEAFKAAFSDDLAFSAEFDVPVHALAPAV